MKKKTEVIKTQNPVISDHTILTTVPYQLCPKCGGDGKILVQNWYGSPTSISDGTETCNLCGGKMIIPMCIISAKNNK